MPALLTAAGNRPRLLARFDQNTCNDAVYRYRASCESSELDHICAVSTEGYNSAVRRYRLAPKA